MIASISKSAAQQIVESVKEVCGQNINLIDTYGIILASTNTARIGSFHEIGRQAAQTGTTICVFEDSSLTGMQKGMNIPVLHNGCVLAVIGITGVPDEITKYAHLAERILKLFLREQELALHSRAQAEKKSYIVHCLIHKKPLQTQYLLHCLAEYHLCVKDTMRVLVIQMHTYESTQPIGIAEQEIKNLFHACAIELYSYQYPDTYVAMIKQTQFQAYQQRIHNFYTKHAKILNIGVGCADTLEHLPHSYQTSLTALKCAVFHTAGYVLYDDLTLEIILGSLAPTVRYEYLQKTIQKLTPEEITLLQIYYEEDMSLSRTASRLFLHKNTLQYQLNRIHKICGINPRAFQEGVLLYLALKIASCGAASGAKLS